MAKCVQKGLFAGLSILAAAWAQPTAGGPFLLVRDSHAVVSHYSREAAGAALTSKAGQPLALASGDFDEDGMPDVVSAYSIGHGEGAVALHRGNAEALWPYSPAARLAPPAAFLPDVRVFMTAESPDFVGAGDFDADGHWDIVTAKLGSHSLYLLRGDGHGGFAAPERIALPGAVTALTTGEINRYDGLTDIAVGITTGAGAKILVFESPGGALRGAPEMLDATAPVSSLVMAALDDSGMLSLAAASGNDLLIIHGRDRKLSYNKSVRDVVAPAEVTRQTFPFSLRQIAAGNFTSHLTDLAVLGDDGKVRFFERPDVDYQAARASQPAALSVRGVAASHVALGPDGRALSASALPVKPKSRALILRNEVALPSSSRAAGRMVAARTTGPWDDLLVPDRTSGQIHFLSRGAKDLPHEQRVMRLSASLAPPDDAPVAVLPMRIRPGAFHSLVMLRSAGTDLLVAETSPPTTFTVTTTADSGPGAGTTSSTDTPGSLRTALTNALSAAGPVNIVFNVPTSDPNYNPNTGVFTFSPISITNCGNSGGLNIPCLTLPSVAANVTIDGYTQPGGTLNAITKPAASPNTLATGNNAVLKIVINAGNAGIGASGISLSFSAGGDTVRGLVITGYTPININGGLTSNGGFGVDIESSGNVVEGNFLGVDFTGATAGPNYVGAGGFGGSLGNTVGGTTPQARNVISGNTFANFGSAVGSITGSYLVEGNYIGTDLTGTVSIGKPGVIEAGQGMVIGGTVAGSSNLISGISTSFGVSLNFPSGNPFTPDFNSVQGNWIGVDSTGAAALPNNTGVGLSTANHNLIGGTTPAARNIISANGSTGIAINNLSTSNTVQGNYIGVDATGTKKLGNGLYGVDHTDPQNLTAALDLIGGEPAGSANVISNNGFHGLIVGGSIASDDGDTFGQTGNTILGNLIGTDPTGSLAMGNQGMGIYVVSGGANYTIGGTDTSAGNTIAFNGGDGVRIDPATNNTLGIAGGSNSVVNNAIFSNGGAGVHVVSGVSNKVSQNSIFSNAQLGLDLDATGPLANRNCNTPNSGANNLQNAPVLTAAPSGATLISATATDSSGNTSEFSNCAAMAFQSGSLNIVGTLNSYANTAFRVEFFQNSSCDASGFGQGKTFLTATSVTTNSSCVANFGVLTDPTKADLSIAVSAPAGGFTQINQSFTYKFSVTNIGAAAAANVVVSNPVPSSLSFTSVTVTQGSCAFSAGTLTCNLGSVSSGSSAQATVVVTATAVGSIPIPATVSSSTPDPVSSNNSSTLTMTSQYALAIVDHFSPVNGIAGAGPLSLTIAGFTFYQGVTTVNVNGTPLSYTLTTNQTCGSDPCQGLNVTIPATFTAAPGTLTINVANPAPGGGSIPASYVIAANPGSVTQFILTGIPNPATQTTPFNMTVTAADASGHVVPGYLGTVTLTGQFIGSETFSPPSPYTFTVGDNGVHVFSTTPTFPGSETITVADQGTPSITGSATFNVNPNLGPPSRIVLGNSPDDTPIGFAFQPLSATVTDALSNLLPNVTVTFTAPSTGASCTFPNGQTTYSAQTDANGNVTVVCTANQTVGSFYQVSVVAGTITQAFFLTNTSNVPAHLTIHVGNNQTSPLNTQYRFDLSVIVSDVNNNPLPFIPVTFTVQAGSGGATGFLASTTAVSERLVDPVPGLAFTSAPPFANGVAGAFTVVASVGSLTATFTETNTNTPNPVAGITIGHGGNQSTAVNTPFAGPIQAFAFDAQGNFISNVPITFTAPSSGAGAALSAAIVSTDPVTGFASVNATANGIRGPFTLTATSGSFSDRTTLTNTGGTINSLSATGGTPQSATVNTAFATALQAQLLDPNGNPLSGQTVTFSVPSSGASANLSNFTATTNGSGVASVTASANATPGAYSVTATASAGATGTVTAMFALTNNARTPASLTITGTPQLAAVGMAFGAPLVVKVLDSSGVGIPGISVAYSAPAAGASATLATSPAITDVSGNASVTATANTVTGPYSVTATVGSLTRTFALINTAGDPASITATAGTPQSIRINTALGTPLQATVKDAFGNGVSGISVTFAAPGSGATGTFTGSTTVTTSSSGIATAPAFTANGTQGSYSITATAAGVATPATFALTNSVIVPGSIVTTAGTPQSATIGTPFATLLQALVKDTTGTPMSGASVTFTAPSSGATGTFANGTASTAVTTNASGIATATVLTANATAGSFGVTAAVSGLGATASFSLTNTPPTAGTIAGNGAQSTVVNTAFGTALQATVTDTNGNALPGATVTFGVPLSGASAVLSGPTAVTNGAGVASVGATANTAAGTYNVTASVNGITVNFSLTNRPGPAVSLTATAGTPQSTPVNSTFSAQLQATAKDTYGNPVSGVSVTFAAPAVGATAVFSSTPSATTNAAGVATAPTALANGAIGSYVVTASAGSLSASFSLSNTSSTNPNVTVALTSSNYSPVLNTPVVLTAVLGGDFSRLQPAGTVTFSDNGHDLGTVPISGGLVTMSDTIGAGPHYILARYNGDGTFGPSAAFIGLSPIKPSPVTTISVTPSSAAAGQSMTFMVQVTGTVAGLAQPTGNVVFYEGLITYGSVPLSSAGVATFTTAALPVGSHVIFAAYEGDVNWNVADIGSVTVTVSKPTAGGQ